MEEKANIILERLKEKLYDISLIRDKLKNEINILEKKIKEEEFKIWIKDESAIEKWKIDLPVFKEKELRVLIDESNLRLKILKLQHYIDEKNGLNDSELDRINYEETKTGIIVITRASIKYAAETGIINKTCLEQYNSYLIMDPEFEFDKPQKLSDEYGSNSTLKKFARNELKEKLKVFIKDEKLKPGETVPSKKINKFIRQMEDEGYSITPNVVRAKLGLMGYSKEK
jgi:hypothetical protein